MKAITKIFLIVALMALAIGCFAGCDMQALQSGSTGTGDKSAYQIWLDAGNTGTEEDFLNWLSANATTDSAANRPESQGLDFELLEDGTYKLIGRGSCQDEYVVIPSTYNDKPVTVIAGGTFYDEYGGTKGIIMPDSITVLEDYAIDECIGLEELVLSDNLEEIGSIYGVGYKVGIWKDGVRYFGSRNNPYLVAYSSTQSIVTANIEEGCKRIESYAFYYCPVLEEVIMPDSVTTIGNYAFTGCEKLERVTISNSVTSIEEETFFSCISLTEVVIPEGVTTIGEAAFVYCDNLTSVTMPSTLTTISSYAFAFCAKLDNVVIPGSVTAIDTDAFYNCTGLTTLTLNEGLEIINNSAFNACTSLAEVVIPNSVKVIMADVFYSCTGLTSVTFGTGLQHIGWSAFANCESLTEIVLPEGLLVISDWVFSNCANLAEVTIPESVTDVGFDVFTNSTNLSVINYAGSQEQWQQINADWQFIPETVTINFAK